MFPSSYVDGIGMFLVSLARPSGVPFKSTCKAQYIVCKIVALRGWVVREGAFYDFD